MSNIYICGDLHGNQNSIRNFYNNYIKNTPKEQEENWMICLGDFGALYYFDYRDRNFKQNLSHYPFKYFVIRGNHEERASNRAKMEPDLWEEVECFGSTCLRQPAFPNIYYAKDEGGIYTIDGLKTLVIPGGYSVDKWYRLRMGWSWFPDEQLVPEEMKNLEKLSMGQEFDFILSHTCPLSFQPTDMFLNFIDQSTVDNTMEVWMEAVRKEVRWNYWLFGHYHADRIEAPHVEQFYTEVEDLESIEARWKKYDETGELDWWLPLSPAMQKIVNK